LPFAPIQPRFLAVALSQVPERSASPTQVPLRNWPSPAALDRGLREKVFQLPSRALAASASTIAVSAAAGIPVRAAAASSAG
jgi:hypothetical protein